MLSNGRSGRREVGLLTYSTKPRGGVVHTVHLGEALARSAVDVEVIALGDPAAGFFRPASVPCHFVTPPERATTLEERVFRSVDALAKGLSDRQGQLPPILHAQDCIAARAACKVRDEGAPVIVVRTVHHVDDFTTPALIECQEQAIVEPDHVLVVSRQWQEILYRDYGVRADVVPNGVDGARFSRQPAPGLVEALRARVGATDRPLLLAVGGIEPRKGSTYLLEALSILKAQATKPPVLAIVGGHSFQDYRAYREDALDVARSLGLAAGDDFVEVGTVPEEEMAAWYHAADVLTFPSVKEGFGLAVVEAMAAGLPVVATELPVFREYLADGRDALLVPPEDPAAIVAAVMRLLGDDQLRERCVAHGMQVAAGFTWTASADRHRALYRSFTAPARATG